MINKHTKRKKRTSCIIIHLMENKLIQVAKIYTVMEIFQIFCLILNMSLEYNLIVHNYKISEIIIDEYISKLLLLSSII